MESSIFFKQICQNNKLYKIYIIYIYMFVYISVVCTLKKQGMHWLSKKNSSIQNIHIYIYG